MKTTTKKKFDCVAMKRRGTAYVHQLTKGMTREQELAFWQEQEAKVQAKRTGGMPSRDIVAGRRAIE